MWENRFGRVDQKFHERVDEMLALDFAPVDLVHQFPLFTGHVNLARYLALYEAYKLVTAKSGHLADVGTWLGTSFLFAAKLVRLFEPYAATRVHAFDWFQGMDPENTGGTGNYRGSYESLRKLVEIQELEDVAVIHRLDLKSELEDFGRSPQYSEIRFKYVFLDCGVKNVLDAAVPFFWERLLPGGVMLFDHFGTDVPHESSVVLSALPTGTEFRQFGFTRQPTAYVIK
jgi:hypothetical protein